MELIIGEESLPFVRTVMADRYWWNYDHVHYYTDLLCITTCS